MKHGRATSAVAVVAAATAAAVAAAVAVATAAVVAAAAVAAATAVAATAAGGAATTRPRSPDDFPWPELRFGPFCYLSRRSFPLDLVSRFRHLKAPASSQTKEGLTHVLPDRSQAPGVARRRRLRRPIRAARLPR